MISVPYALYEAFTDTTFGGSPAAIVLSKANLPAKTRQRIARELGIPATGFVTNITADSIDLRFHSAVTEYPMCGHGTICVLTWLLDSGQLSITDSDTNTFRLNLPTVETTVDFKKREDGRFEVLLDIQPPDFDDNNADLNLLLEALNINHEHIDPGLPIEIARGDFTHLLVPVKNVDVMKKIAPDFSALKLFSEKYELQTIVPFCLDTIDNNADVHMRDFCPAVGSNESAATGTTNCALSCYLFRHNLFAPDDHQSIRIIAEQGIEMNRPSRVESIMDIAETKIQRIRVGGVAQKFFEGFLFLPDECTHD